MTAWFPSKAAAERCVREILDRNLGQYLSGDDERVLRDLVAQHPNHDAKIGDRSYRLKAIQDRKLLAIFEDGSSDAVSWRKCIHGTDHRSEVIAAAREHIASQKPPKTPAIIGTDCPKCHKKIKPADYFCKNGLHWDHHPKTFETIWQEWMELEEISELDITAYDKQFQDQAQADRWAAFHRKEVQWRLVHRRCNLSDNV